MAKRVLVRRVYDDPIIVDVDDFGPLNIAQDYTWRTSGIIIRSDSTWSPGTLVINLNGYTLTYGGGTHISAGVNVYAGTAYGDGNVAHAAILCATPTTNHEYFLLSPAGYFGYNNTDDLTVLINGPGTIRSGSGQGLKYSDGLLLTGIDELELDNVTFDINCPDSLAVRWLGGEVQNCNIDIARAAVENRHQQPAAIHSEAKTCHVHDNVISNTLCIGIRCDKNAEINDNTIAIDSAAETNHFGIISNPGVGETQTIHDNIITTTDGRGISFSGDGTSTSTDDSADTTVASGPYLNHCIQIEGAADVAILRMTAVARADGTHEADALNLKDIDAASPIDIQDSTFTAYEDGVSGRFAAAVSLYSNVSEGTWTDGAASTIYNCTFDSDSYLMWWGYNGEVRNWVFDSCTFEHLGDGSTFHRVDVAVVAVSAITLLDCTFTNCDPRNMEAGDFAGNEDVSVAVKWTITLSGTPGAAYTCVDILAVTQASGNLDGGGGATVELPEVSVKWNGTTHSEDHTEHNDYTITINGKDQSVTVDSAKTVTEP